MWMQLNLFGGSVANLGDDAQRKWLQGVFDKGELGCFCTVSHVSVSPHYERTGLSLQ